MYGATVYGPITNAPFRTEQREKMKLLASEKNPQQWERVSLVLAGYGSQFTVGIGIGRVPGNICMLYASMHACIERQADVEPLPRRLVVLEYVTAT